MNEQNYYLSSKKLIILSVSLFLFLVIILPILLTFAIKVIPGGIQPPLGNTVKIYDDYIYSQAFVSPENNLTGIGVSIKNPNFANKKKLIVNLYDENNVLLRTTVLNGQNIADGNFVKILFDPIKDSANKKFIWSVLSPESVFEDAMEIFLTNEQPNWSLDLKVNEKLYEGGFSYVTLHRPSSRTDILFRVLNDFIYKVKSDAIFSVSYFVLLMSLVTAAIFLPNHWRK